MAKIRGSDIKEGTRIKTWFMPGGTMALSFEEYRGPMAYLWPKGARIISFAATTKSGVLGMTVENDDLFELA